MYAFIMNNAHKSIFSCIFQTKIYVLVDLRMFDRLKFKENICSTSTTFSREYQYKPVLLEICSKVRAVPTTFLHTLEYFCCTSKVFAIMKETY